MKLAFSRFLPVFALVLASKSGFAQNPQYVCEGEAEDGKIRIVQLTISDEAVRLVYSAEEQVTVKAYWVTEWKRNGHTDVHQPAFFIGGTSSGRLDDSDDIALPHLGWHKTGIGSEVAFNHDSNRVFGNVNCLRQ